MLPPLVYAVKALGWAQGVAFLVWSARDPLPISLSTAAGSSLGSPGVLLTYRALCAAWGLALGLNQLKRVGPAMLSYATVWNWLMLTAYFVTATAVSTKAALLRSAGGQYPATARPGMEPWAPSQAAQEAESSTASHEPGSSSNATPLHDDAATADSRAAGAKTRNRVKVPGPQQVARAVSGAQLEHAMWAMYHVAGPMVIVIDLMTWLVLMPMLMATPDEKQREIWYRQHHNFESYNQHGFNAVMMLGEVALNRLPVHFLLSGWLAIWASAYAIWSTVFFYMHGRFIYPFLDAYKPYAWLSYLGLYAVHWTAFLLFSLVIRAKEWVVQMMAAAPQQASKSN